MSVLSQLSVSSPVSYLAAFLVPALDAVLPVLPSETVVIALGVATAGRADPRIAVLVALAACGAFAGDNLCYFLGLRFGPLARRRLFSGPRGQRSLAWAEQALQRFGARIIVVCRFVPGGRTAVTFTCGVVAVSLAQVRGRHGMCRGHLGQLRLLPRAAGWQGLRGPAVAGLPARFRGGPGG